MSCGCVREGRCARHEPMVYVLTWQGDDPFVAGGVPLYATTSERDAWDHAAELLAEGTGYVWAQPWLRGRQTELQVAAGIGHNYNVFPLRLVDNIEERT